MKLQSKILLGVLPVITVAIAILATSAVLEFQNARERAVADRLTAVTLTIAKRFHAQVAGGRPEPEVVRDIVVGEGLESEGQLLLVDAAGEIVVRSGAVGQRPELPPDLTGILAGEGLVRTRIGERVWMFTGRRLRPQLHVLAGLPVPVLSPQTQPVPKLVALSLGGLLLIAGLCWLLLRRVLTRPLQVLEHVAEEVGRGNLLLPTAVRSRDEIGALAETIKEMGQNLRQTTEQIRYFAYHDSLTRLPNRRMFNEYLKRAVANAQRHNQSLAILFVDLDDFKRINDTLGHQAGDFLLRELAERLTQGVRAADYVGRAEPGPQESETVARLGGDEFIILLPNVTGPYWAATVAERVLAAIAQPIRYRDEEQLIGASIGIALFPTDASDAETLVKNADLAMYHAKERGKNGYQYFHEAMNAAAATRLKLERALRKAVDREELSLCYQPQVDLATGRIVAVEALVRWQHPEEGLITPNRFLPLAEESGLIVPIGEWVIQAACAQARTLRAAGFADVSVAINLSGLQFLRLDLLGVLKEALEGEELPPGVIEVELSEDAIMRAEAAVSRALPRIKELGITVALDKFGTGYSALNYLRRLPIDKLKVDVGFVRDQARDGAIFSAILTLAESLRIPVTAEAVETRAQIDFLRQRGCRFAQGYLINRPLPSELLFNLLRGPPIPP